MRLCLYYLSRRFLPRPNRIDCHLTDQTHSPPLLHLMSHSTLLVSFRFLFSSRRLSSPLLSSIRIYCQDQASYAIFHSTGFHLFKVIDLKFVTSSQLRFVGRIQEL